MKQTTLDKELLPRIWLYWQTTKDNFFLDCQTGEKTNHAPQGIKFGGDRGPDGVWRCNGNIRLNANSKPVYAYVKYHDDIEMLEIAAVTLDTTRKAEPKEWRYAGNKYFIDKHKVVYDENGKVPSNYSLYTGHSSYDFKHILSFLYNLNYHPNAVEEIKRFIGGPTFTISSGRVVNIEYLYHLQVWYKTSQKVRGKGKQTKLAEKLTAMPHGDISNLLERYPDFKMPEPRYCGIIVGIIYYERLEDGWSVLRMLTKKYSADSLVENERMYLHDDGTNRIVTKSGSNWVPAKQMQHWSSCYKFINRDEAMEKCKRLKYLLPLFDADDMKIRQYIMTALRFPEVEQLMKLGCVNEAKSIAGSSTPRADLKDMFGGYYDEKEKSLLKKAGLTKHQFDRLMNKHKRERSNVIRRMRDFFGDEFIHLDNATFDEYFDAFRSVSPSLYSGYYNHVERLNLDLKRVMKNIIRLAKRNDNVYHLYPDTMSMYIRLNEGTQPAVDWYFDSLSDLNRMHDAIMELYNQQQAEQWARWNMAEAERLKKEEEKRIKLDEKRKEWEYEDDEFIIRLPRDGAEIIAEGSKQHICIGGYVSIHSVGETNLFFVRKKSEPEVPFYAIEVRNNVVIQIHGFANCWLGNNPEAIPSVVRFLRKNKFKCDEKILTCTATGYGQINNYIRMPVVED